MARRREYDRDAVIEAAQQAFWRHGYEAAGLDVLEHATRLSRSSMYLAFGSKRGLFDEAIARYRSTFMESVLGPVESKVATADDAAGFFLAIASLFRGDLGSRGCLVINSIGELAGRDRDVTQEGADLYERYRVAFANALRGGAKDRRVTDERAQVLAVSAMGAWITSRVDPQAAAKACDAVVAQIDAWVHPSHQGRSRAVRSAARGGSTPSR